MIDRNGQRSTETGSTGPEAFTVIDVARRLGLSDVTIRNWTRRYADTLSDSAAPAPGSPRTFTPRDVNILAYVAACAADGMTHAQIARRLQETSFPDVLQAPEGPAEPAEGIDTAEGQIAPQGAAMGDYGPPVLAGLVVTRLDGIQDRLQALESQKSGVTWFALGALAGAAFVVAGLLIATLLIAR